MSIETLPTIHRRDGAALCSVRLVRPPVPRGTLKVGIAIVMVAQSRMSRLKRSRIDLERAVELVDERGHSLACADNDAR